MSGSDLDVRNRVWADLRMVARPDSRFHCDFDRKSVVVGTGVDLGGRPITY